MTPQDTAHRIIDTNHYLTLATADRDGHPWASPVYYTPDDGLDFYWVSRPDSRHSRNLTERHEVAIVIFDSRQPVFTGEAVYLTAHAEQVAPADLARCTEIYRNRLPELTTFEPERLQELASFEPQRVQEPASFEPQRVQEPAALRLYRAHAVEASVLVADDGPDLRIPLELPIRSSADR